MARAGALWRDGRRLLRLGALVLAPLLLYLYLPWAESRNLPPGTWHPRTAREWYDYLFDTGRTGLVYVDPDDLGEMLRFYARTLLRDFTWAGTLLGIGGLAWQFRRRPADALFLSVNYVAQAFLAANHHVPRHWVYFIPSFLIYALWVGEALSAIWLTVERRWLRRFPIPHPATSSGCQPQSPIPNFQPPISNPQFSNLLIPVLLAIAMLTWPLLPFPQRYRPLRQAHLGAGVLDVWRQTLKTGHMGDRIGRAIASVAPNAVIVCDWEQVTPLWYYQQVEGLRPDVRIFYPVERLDEAAALGWPLYLARAHGGLADRWHPSCSSSLIALRSTPVFDLPPDATPSNVRLHGEGGAFEVAGYAYGEAAFHPGTVVPLTLYWRALAVPAHDYSVSLRFFDGSGGQVGQVDSQHPVLGTYPTSRWAAGEVVGDYYEFQLPHDLAPGAYQWGAILYRALPEGGWESLKVDGTEGEVAMGAAFEIWSR